MSGPAVRLSFTIILTLAAGGLLRGAQSPQPQAVFRAAVDMVSVAAVVRDKQGRIVPSLPRDEFTVIDGSEPRSIVDFQADSNAPIGVALLIDGSGSMPRDAALVRRIGHRLLAQLDPGRDEAALMSFDTRLLNLRPFTDDFDKVRSGLQEVDAFGATSIYDAIAGAAGIVATATQKRRALVVVTDGTDNASSYTPDEVAWIASTIDVPVYVVAVGSTTSSIDPAPAFHHGGSLGAIARATGGDYFAAGTATQQQIALGRIVEELRHQYLIAFEPGSGAGVRELAIKTRNTALRVRARRWYSPERD